MTARKSDLAESCAATARRLRIAADHFAEAGEMLGKHRLGRAEAALALALAEVEAGLDAMPRAPPVLAEAG